MWTVGKISQPDTPRKKWTRPTLTTFLPATPQLMDSALALSVAVIDMQIASWICIMQMSGQTSQTYKLDGVEPTTIPIVEHTFC